LNKPCRLSRFHNFFQICSTQLVKINPSEYIISFGLNRMGNLLSLCLGDELANTAIHNVGSCLSLCFGEETISSISETDDSDEPVTNISRPERRSGLDILTGALVSTPYGPGRVVAEERDDGIVAVKLSWGAIGYFSGEKLCTVCEETLSSDRDEKTKVIASIRGNSESKIPWRKPSFSKPKPPEVVLPAQPVVVPPYVPTNPPPVLRPYSPPNSKQASKRASSVGGTPSDVLRSASFTGKPRRASLIMDRKPDIIPG
jgi:hypothetical protein